MYLEYFNKATAADPAYAPALYSLYLYQYYHDAANAMEYYKRFMTNADKSVQNDYDLTDLLFLNKDYNAAIQKAKMIEQQEGNVFQPRLYKLIGYSYAGLKDPAQAIVYMQRYFEKLPTAR